MSKTLNQIMFSITGIVKDFEAELRAAESPAKFYSLLSWYIPRGAFRNGQKNFDEFKEALIALRESTKIDIDVTGDGEVTDADINFIIQNIGLPITEENKKCDINNDGVIDFNDVAILVDQANTVKHRVFLDKELSGIDMFKVLPILVTDGINEFGLTCNLNIVPDGHDIPPTTGTNPGNPHLCVVGIIRYILDNCACLEDVMINLAKRDIYCPNSDVKREECHVMLNDNGRCCIIEFTRCDDEGNYHANQLTFILENIDIDSFKPEYQDEIQKLIDNNKIYLVKNNANIMTNFHINFAKFDDEYFGKNMSKYPAGVERYKILKESIANGVTSVSQMQEIMKSIRYTNAYRSFDTDNPWYSEFTGDYTSVGLDEYTYDKIKTEEGKVAFMNLFNKYIKPLWERKERGKDLWQTSHSCVYDIANQSMVVTVQEDYEHNFERNLGELPNIEEDTPVKLGDYIYELITNNYDFEALEKILEEKYTPFNGGCSSVYSDGFYGRNFDWYYDEGCTSIYHTQNNENHYASLGIMGSVNTTPDIMDVGKDYYGKVVINSEDDKFDVGNLVEIKAIPAPGYKFIKWNDNNTERIRKIKVSNIDKYNTYKAYFKKID